MRKKAFKSALWCFLLLGSFRISANNNGSDLPMVTQFELVRGMVVVQAELNGEMANFILDTGSPMMILNGKASDTASSEQGANGLHGGMAGQWQTIGMFSWAGVRKFDMQALTTDIGALEAVTNRPIAGLIGYDFLEDFELLIDFERLLITLVPNGTAAKMDGWQLKAELPFMMAGHLPVIEVQIGGKKLRLGLDTGANTNLLDLSKSQELDKELITPVSNGGVLGMNGGTYATHAADVVETTIAGQNYWNMRFVFSDISHLHNLVDNQVDGLLGFPFFKSGKFSLNYSRKVISFWE
jgi:predicted aspartyl protease